MMDVHRALENLDYLKQQYQKYGKTITIAVAFDDDGEMLFFSDDGRGNGDHLFSVRSYQLCNSIIEFYTEQAKLFNRDMTK